eukprot:SAG11_NODE_1871_length_4150_cov_26.309800_1_plen_814_part_00
MTANRLATDWQPPDVAELPALLHEFNCSSKEMLLVEAARSTDTVHVMTHALRAGADVNHQADGSGYSALHMAAAGDNAEAIRLLLRAGGAIDMLDAEGRTPLMHAARCGSEGSLCALVEGGANMGQADEEGHTAYSLCWSQPNLQRQLVAYAIDKIAAKQRLAWAQCWAPCRQLCWQRTADGRTTQPVMVAQSMPLYLGDLPVDVAAQIAGGVLAQIQSRRAARLPLLRRCFQEEHQCWDDGKSVTKSCARPAISQAAAPVFPDISLAMERRLGDGWVAEEAERRAVAFVERWAHAKGIGCSVGSGEGLGRRWNATIGTIDWKTGGVAKRSLKLLEVASARVRSNVTACVRLASVRLALGEHAAALEAADRAAAASEHEWAVESHELRGRSLLGLGRVSEALAAFDDGLRLAALGGGGARGAGCNTGRVLAQQAADAAAAAERWAAQCKRTMIAGSVAWQKGDHGSALELYDAACDATGIQSRWAEAGAHDEAMLAILSRTAAQLAVVEAQPPVQRTELLQEALQKLSCVFECELAARHAFSMQAWLMRGELHNALYCAGKNTAEVLEEALQAFDMVLQLFKMGDHKELAAFADAPAVPTYAQTRRQAQIGRRRVRRILHALRLKAEGNAVFRRGGKKAAQRALRSYTEALELEPRLHEVLSNRSACHATLGDWAASAADAALCVEMAPEFGRGHERLLRAQLRLTRASGSSCGAAATVQRARALGGAAARAVDAVLAKHPEVAARLMSTEPLVATLVEPRVESSELVVLARQRSREERALRARAEREQEAAEAARQCDDVELKQTLWSLSSV